MRRGRGPARPIPRGFTVVPIDGLHYPMRIVKVDGLVSALVAFHEDDKAVSFARHGNAVDFLEAYVHFAQFTQNEQAAGL